MDRWIRTLGIICILLLISAAMSYALPSKTGELNKPYLEWELKYDYVEENPYNVIAYADFIHPTGKKIRSLMFYDGGNLWKFRFTGMKTGTWKIETHGPGSLGGQTGEVVIKKGHKTWNGFMIAQGKKWLWSGSGFEVVPQFVMHNEPGIYWENGRVNTKKIDDFLEEFVIEHQFTGIHFPGGKGWWFNIHEPNTVSKNKKPISVIAPDRRTYQVFEAFLTRAYKKGAAVHIWLWGSDGFGYPHSGPEGIDGPMSAMDKLNLRYIAARLGPIPGWSMGYGFDLHAWADAEELQTWYEFMKKQLGGWPHILGARADLPEGFKNNGEVRRHSFDKVYWKGDYASYYDYRASYAWYVKTLKDSDKPSFQEDRFRNRVDNRWNKKDYTPDMTRRGLWHSTMAGGVANIWGNLLPHNDNNQGSRPYDNKAKGEIQGVEFTVDIKDAIHTYHEFWFGKKRFSYDMVRDNKLTDNQTGPDMLDPKGGGYIRVCLRDKDFKRLIFYVENTDSLRMNLRKMEGKQSAIAVDTKKPYKEIKLDTLEARLYESFELPYLSDWAVIIGE